MTKRIAAVVTASVLSFGALTVAAAPAHACADLQCRVICLVRERLGGPCPD
jgi:hypothetical protein